MSRERDGMILKNDYSNGQIINLDLDKDILFIDVASSVPKAALTANDRIYGLHNERNINTNRLEKVGILDIKEYNRLIDGKVKKIAIFLSEENAVLFTPLFQALGFIVLSVNKKTGYLETVNVPNSNFQIADFTNIANYKSYILSILEKKRVVFTKSDVSFEREYKCSYEAGITMLSCLGERPYSSNKISSYMNSIIAKQILDSRYSLIGGNYYRTGIAGILSDFRRYYEDNSDTSYLSHKYYSKIILDIKKLIIGYNIYFTMNRDRYGNIVEKLVSIKDFKEFDNPINDEINSLLKVVHLKQIIEEVYFPLLRVYREYMVSIDHDTAMWGEKIV